MKIPIDPLSLVPMVSGVFSLWSKTLRIDVHGEWEKLLEERRRGQPFVIAMWHGEIFPILSFAQQSSTSILVVVSQSKDGEFITRVLERLGHSTVRGSSSRGGVRALLQAKRAMDKDNKLAVFTVDGPRGPRHKVKDGVIFLAQRAGAKIIPIRAYAKSKKVFDKSWDHFFVPSPFSKCSFYLGEPMEVTSEKLDKDVMAREKARLEQRMLSLGEDYE